MPPEPKLVVKHSRGQYPIYADQNWLDQVAKILDSLSRRLVLISDENVADLYARKFREFFDSSWPLLVIPAGESSKSLQQAELLYEQLSRVGLDRHGMLVALGGGVVGDLTGFVAATWMRGIDWIQIPTTLLAQVDSSVGGKTGINLPQAKNCVGAFWQPESVFIDTTVLQTLDDAQYTSGLAEVVKYAVILDEDLFRLLESSNELINRRDPATLEQLVIRCCQLKADVVAADERETTGHRAILNYGHTFGHAIESVFGYGHWLHGHAVAVGMTAAARLARLLNRVDDEFVDRQTRLLQSLNIPAEFPADQHESLLESMTRDKKSVDGNPRFVLPTRIGHVELVDPVDPEQVRQAMRLAAGMDA